MPKMTAIGEGYKITIETDTEVKLMVLKATLREIFRKENIPHDEIKTEGATDIESKSDEQLPSEATSESFRGQNP